MRIECLVAGRVAELLKVASLSIRIVFLLRGLLEIQRTVIIGGGKLSEFRTELIERQQHSAQLFIRDVALGGLAFAIAATASAPTCRGDGDADYRSAGYENRLDHRMAPGCRIGRLPSVRRDVGEAKRVTLGSLWPQGKGAGFSPTIRVLTATCKSAL